MKEIKALVKRNGMIFVYEVAEVIELRTGERAARRD